MQLINSSIQSTKKFKQKFKIITNKSSAILTYRPEEMLHAVHKSVIAEYSFYEKYKNYLQGRMTTVSR